nr:MAG TPA: hypothetical protein [Caudoviricetes sp.]
MRNLKDAHLGADRQTRGNLAALARGLGPLDLYDARTGQRAGPTVHKILESNGVLTPQARRLRRERSPQRRGESGGISLGLGICGTSARDDN